MEHVSHVKVEEVLEPPKKRVEQPVEQPIVLLQPQANEQPQPAAVAVAAAPAQPEIVVIVPEVPEPVVVAAAQVSAAPESQPDATVIAVAGDKQSQISKYDSENARITEPEQIKPISTSASKIHTHTPKYAKAARPSIDYSYATRKVIMPTSAQVPESSLTTSVGYRWSKPKAPESRTQTMPVLVAPGYVFKNIPTNAKPNIVHDGADHKYSAEAARSSTYSTTPHVHTGSPRTPHGYHKPGKRKKATAAKSPKDKAAAQFKNNKK